MKVSPKLPPITVATDDYYRLTMTAQRLAKQFHPLAHPLRQELDRAELCEPDTLPDDVISLDRFVGYRLARERLSEYRALIHPDDEMWSPDEVSILTPVGLSLLGLKVGDRIPLLGSIDTDDIWVEVKTIGPRLTGGFVSRGAKCISF